MTAEEQAFRAKLDKISQLAEDIGKHEDQLERMKQQRSELIYEVQTNYIAKSPAQ